MATFCAAGSLNPMPAIGQDEVAVLLEHDHGREAVALEHRCGILRHGVIVDVGTGLGPGVAADCIKPELGHLCFAVPGTTRGWRRAHSCFHTVFASLDEPIYGSHREGAVMLSPTYL